MRKDGPERFSSILNYNWICIGVEGGSIENFHQFWIDNWIRNMYWGGGQKMIFINFVSELDKDQPQEKASQPGMGSGTRMLMKSMQL